jgi:DMSO/TMAO reductase YedYZ molybdopterin-dependent catalytic subunit
VTEDRDTAEKRVQAKERRAREAAATEPSSGMTWPGHAAARASGRLPPGQRRVDGLPILDLGEQPVLDRRDWKLSVAGRVAAPVTWDWDTLMAQPQSRVTADIHCVTNWSSFDNVFEGVAVSHLLKAVGPLPQAAFVMARGFDGYSTNLPLADLARQGALLCHGWNGAPLSREHGGPVRLLIPHLYFWKSAKWLRHLTVMDGDQPGFWEARGYHRRGDPWAEERYG